MTGGQFFDGGICPNCNTELPKLEDKGAWGLVICPRCKKGFDTDEYRNAGGSFTLAKVVNANLA